MTPAELAVTIVRMSRTDRAEVAAYLVGVLHAWRSDRSDPRVARFLQNAIDALKEV